MGLLDKIRKTFRGVQLDEPIERQRQEALENPYVQCGVWKISEGCNEVANAKGEFGRTRTNPIPVNGINGEFAYINRLRSKNNVGFFFHRLGSTKSSTTNNDVDLYELVSIDGEQWERLYFDMYFTYRSQKAPSGLYLMNWSDAPDHIKIGLKNSFWGTNTYVEDFPFGLPGAIANDPSNKSLSPGLGNVFARKAIEILNKYPKEKWNRPEEWE